MALTFGQPSRGVALAMCLLAIAASTAGAFASPATPNATCAFSTRASPTVRALAAATVQPADLARGWKRQRASLLPRGTSADGPSSHRIGGAVMFARRAAEPELALTSSVELERGAVGACSTYHRWLRALLGARVGTKVEKVPTRLGRETTLLASNETAFGPMVEILWYRGPVLAAVQVQFRSRAANMAAHRWALRFATASDARLRRVLAAS
jgi:hypothetical protein